MPNATINCLIIDDHQAIRVGAKLMLERCNGIKVIGEAGDGEAGAAMAIRRSPDVVLLDVKMPGLDGFKTAALILAARPSANICMFSAHSDLQFLKLGMSSGVKGYVLKDAPGEELERAIRQVAKGGIYVDGKIAHLLMPEHTSKPTLTARELQVLGLLSHGMTTGQAASHLHLSGETVRSHTRNACHKLDAQNRIQAVATAIHLGLIEP